MKNNFFAILILICSVIGSLVVVGKYFPPKFFLPQVVPGPNEAIFEISPASGSYGVGGTFGVDLKISSSANITSVKTYLNFSPALLQGASINVANSVFPTQWEGTINNSNGKIQIQASSPSPGFLGNGGLIARINFQTQSAGTAAISFDPSSLALTFADQNILNLARSTGGSFTISSLITPLPSPTPPPGGGDGGGGGGGDAVVPSPTPTPSATPTPTSSPAATTAPFASTAPKKIIGDLNDDGKVDIYDLSILLSAWKKSNIKYDLSANGVVDIFDLSILLSNWGKT